MPKLKRELIAFTIVGVTGFAVDAGSLILFFHGLGLGHYTARVLAFGVAVTVTWILNRTFTFQINPSQSIHQEYVKYFSSQTAGALINLGVYAICLETMPLMKEFPVIALGIGSGVAMVFNYLAMKLYVFADKKG